MGYFTPIYLIYNYIGYNPLILTISLLSSWNIQAPITNIHVGEITNLLTIDPITSRDIHP